MGKQTYFVVATLEQSVNHAQENAKKKLIKCLKIYSEAFELSDYFVLEELDEESESSCTWIRPSFTFFRMFLYFFRWNTITKVSKLCA